MFRAVTSDKSRSVAHVTVLCTSVLLSDCSRPLCYCVLRHKKKRMEDGRK